MLEIVRSTAAAVLLAAMALPASAGVYYEADTTTSGGDRTTTMKVKAWVDGDRARVEFEEASGQPFISEGAYLVTTDGGKTVYLVDPAEKTYSEWDIAAMLQTAGAMMESVGGMIDFEISDPEVEQLLAEDGGSLLGLPTRHYRYRTRYSMKMKVLGMRQSNESETVQDLWVTDQLDELALGVWLRNEPPASGNEDLDRLIAAEFEKVQGFPLKTVAVTTTVGGRKGKRRSETTTTTEVVRLERRDTSGQDYGWPDDYQRTEILPTGGEEEEGRGPFGKLFKRDG